MNKGSLTNQGPINPFPVPGIPSGRPSEPSMLAAAVGTAPGTARTKKKCPGIVQVIKMGVISGLESRNGHLSAPRASIVVPADGQPWRRPAGKPWHEFVSGCDSGGAFVTKMVSRSPSSSNFYTVRSPTFVCLSTVQSAYVGHRGPRGGDFRALRRRPTYTPARRSRARPQRTTTPRQHARALACASREQAADQTFVPVPCRGMSR